MNNKTDETFHEAILTLRDWLGFLDQKEREFTEQLERSRRKPEEAQPGEPPGEVQRDGWL
jgi:hypothetical protein